MVRTTRRAQSLALLDNSHYSPLKKNAAGPSFSHCHGPLDGSCDDVLTSLQGELDERIASIEAMAEEAATSIENAVAAHIAKLPKKVRTMTLGEFRNAFGLKLTDATTTTNTRSENASSPPPGAGANNEGEEQANEPTTVVRTTRKRKATESATARAQAAAAATAEEAGLVTPQRPIGKAGKTGRTPAPTPGSAARRAKRGEQAFSANGSPLAALAEGEENEGDDPAGARGAKAAKNAAGGAVTVTLAKAAPTRSRTRRGVAAAADTSDASALKLTTEDGQELDLGGDLSKEQRSWALKTLNALASQVGSLLGRLK
ncbi:hypothetical protein PPROV_000746600 [Pycnococcus provasolii]|uniref:Borealin N-terminal domain-containing protein n=1 Tax=Pycnococcus provasolii TaxID=41880 RepID=A0A830HUY9_9CHLO|nr:hypothetical protein PPROV_000746600 [Pycnococcus provasolii]